MLKDNELVKIGGEVKTKNKQSFGLLIVIVCVISIILNLQFISVKANTGVNTYLPFVSGAKPVPNAPSLNKITNSNQDNIYTVTWGAVNYAISYQLQEAVDPLFSNTIVVYQGSYLSWTVPSPGKIPNPYYYRVKAINESGESPWSNVQQVTIYPMFVGLQVRWDGSGYIRGNEYYDIGTYQTRNFDQLSQGYIIRANNHAWYYPNPFSWPDEYWYNYYSVTTGELLSSSIPPDPSWKWNCSALLPYSIQYQNGQTVLIEGQAFIVSGPISGYTSFGALVQYWQLVNRDRFLYWDGGGDWTEYVYVGEAILRYDAGNTRLLIYDNITRHDYYQGNPYNETVQYIENLTAANSFPGSLSLSIAPSEIIPDVTPSVSDETNKPLLKGIMK